MSDNKVDESLLDRIGYMGLFEVVFRATKFGSLLTLPYGLFVYRGFLNNSISLEDLFEQHRDRYEDPGSKFFRKHRPSYNIARTILKEQYNIR